MPTEKKPPLSTLSQIGLFQGLSSAELSSIRSCLREKTFEKGELLFYEGKSCERIFIVLTGRVKVYRTAASGREQILEVLESGDTCACNPGATVWSCSSSAEAVTACKVWFLSREDYVRLVRENAKLTHTLNRIFAERLSHFSCLIEEVSLNDAKKRLVKFLLDMLEERVKSNEEQDTLYIPFTREEIAQRIGSARETVARYLHELKRSRLIEIKPRQIIILDEEALKSLLN